VDLVAIRDDVHVGHEVTAAVTVEHVVNPGEQAAEDDSVGDAIQKQSAEVRSVEEDPEQQRE
jgi:hypothetical protein